MSQTETLWKVPSALIFSSLPFSFSLPFFGTGPNTVSGSTVSNTELSEFFLGSLSSGERTQWVPLSLLFVRQSELTEFFAELTEFAVKLSEFSSPKQYSRNSIPPVSYFSFSRNSLQFWALFPSFPRIFGVRQAEEILALLVVFLAVFQKRQGKEAQGVCRDVPQFGSGHRGIWVCTWGSWNKSFTPCFSNIASIYSTVFPWKLKPGFINRALVAVIFEASKCL